MGLDTSVVYNYNNGDELFTKENAIIPLLEFIPKDAVVWECAEKKALDGNITKLLRKNGIKVITTSIHNGEDFLLTDLPKGVTHIITNPPFSLKNEFLKRCYEHNLPFALLLPTNTLDGVARFNMYQNGLELLLFDRRVSYEGSKSSPPFASGWFCNKILPEKIVFRRLEK
jgi:hypothetical protein